MDPGKAVAFLQILNENHKNNVVSYGFYPQFLLLQKYKKKKLCETELLLW